MKVLFMGIIVILIVGCGIKEKTDNSIENSTILTKDSLPEDFKSLKVLAEKGDVRAQLELGEMLRFGKGVKPNQPEAAIYYQKAAKQGCAMAQWRLGKMCIFGDGLPEDHVEAINWFRKAAEQGFAQAQYELGKRYLEGGLGVPANPAAAEKWIRKAAEQGDDSAQHCLAEMYFQGIGLKENHVLAYAWINILAAKSHQVENRHRELKRIVPKSWYVHPKLKKEDLEKELSQTEIAQGRSLSTEMIKKNPNLLN